MNETRPYELSLTIVFLDRLGHPGDRPTIQLLGLRLLGGQGKNGGWNYDCGYLLNADEESRLKTLFARESKLVAKVGNPLVNNSQSNSQNPAPDRKIAAEMIPAHPEVTRWAKLVNLPGEAKGDFGQGKDGDNSNTQFAAIGVWCARRNGVPCDKAIALMEKRFRTSQDSDGGWSYHYFYGGEGSTASMTCEGLLGLAMSQGPKSTRLKTSPTIRLQKATTRAQRKPQRRSTTKRLSKD